MTGAVTEGGPGSPGFDFRPIVDFPGYAIGADRTVWSRRVRGGHDRSGRPITWHRLAIVKGRHCRSVNLRRDGRDHARTIESLYRAAFGDGRIPPSPAWHKTSQAEDDAEDDFAEPLAAPASTATAHRTPLPAAPPMPPPKRPVRIPPYIPASVAVRTPGHVYTPTNHEK